jgi:hypothetical protein
MTEISLAADQAPTIAKKGDALYLSDVEIARRLGVGEKSVRAAFREFERRRGFPKKDRLFGDKRYWPAVKAFLDRRHGLSMSSAPLAPDGEEKPFHD